MNVTKRIRTTAIAGIMGLAALLGGTAAAVVAAPASTQPAVHYEAAPPGPTYDPAQLANKYAGTQPATTYEGIQLTDLFNLAAPGPDYED